MKRIYVNEKWCLGCHLCEYYCAFANSGKSDMVKALSAPMLFDYMAIVMDKQARRARTASTSPSTAATALTRCASRAASPGR